MLVLCVCVFVCVHTSVYVYAQVSSSRVRMSRYATGVVRTFNKHSSLAIFNEHLVRQAYQG